MGETVFTEFNAHGNVTKKTEKYGTSKNEAYYSYNSDSKPEKIVFINRDKKKEVLHTEVVFRYKNDSVFVKTDINEKGKKGEKSFVMIYEKEWMKKYYGKRKDDLEEYLLDYDAHGNKLSETKYVNGELIATKKYRYTYDENGKLKSKVFDDNTTTTFYPNGLIKTMEEYSYKYDGYDTFGNWTTMTINENKKIIYKTIFKQ